jgi:hypothetical protein
MVRCDLLLILPRGACGVLQLGRWALGQGLAAPLLEAVEHGVDELALAEGQEHLVALLAGGLDLSLSPFRYTALRSCRMKRYNGYDRLSLILLAIGAVPVSNATRVASISLCSASSDLLILENTDALASFSALPLVRALSTSTTRIFFIRAELALQGSS